MFKYGYDRWSGTCRCSHHHHHLTSSHPLIITSSHLIIIIPRHQVVGDVSMLAGSVVYGAYLTEAPLRRLFVGLQLVNVLASGLDLVLALHLNEALGLRR
jgi:hypothetical protein